jgi:hypothetical protein
MRQREIRLDGQRSRDSGSPVPDAGDTLLQTELMALKALDTGNSGCQP